MKCLRGVKTGKNNLKCYKDCNFIFCREHWGAFLRSKVGRVSIVLAFLITSIFLIKPILKSKYYRGELKPFSYLNSSFGFALGTSGLKMTSGRPIKEVSLDSLPSLGYKCPNDSLDNPLTISFECKKDAFTVSLMVHDLNGKVIGDLKNNQFAFLRSMVGKIYSDSSVVEIEDLAGDVIFSISRDGLNFPQIRGYFRENKCILCVNNLPTPLLVDTLTGAQIKELGHSMGPLFINE